MRVAHARPNYPRVILDQGLFLVCLTSLFIDEFYVFRIMSEDLAMGYKSSQVSNSHKLKEQQYRFMFLYLRTPAC